MAEPKHPFNQKLWDDLNQTIREGGGALTSPPGNRMKFVASLDSELPDELRGCGWDIVPAGTEQRLWPFVERVPAGGGQFIIREHVTEHTVAVFEFDISTVDKIHE
jgi:hypothetical protein